MLAAAASLRRCSRATGRRSPSPRASSSGSRLSQRSADARVGVCLLFLLPAQVDELERKEEELFRTGPLSVLTTSVKTNSQVGAGGLGCGVCRLAAAAPSTAP